MLKECETKAHIPAINTPEGKITTNLQAINNTFLTFYENLYKSEMSDDDATSKHFLDKLELPCLKQTDQDDLEAALELDELHRHRIKANHPAWMASLQSLI